MQEYISFFLEDSLIFQSCGYFVSPKRWSHITRKTDHFVLLFVVAGSFSLTVGSREFVLHSGDVIVLPPNIIHSGSHSVSDDVEYYWVHFWARKNESQSSCPMDREVEPDCAYIPILCRPGSFGRLVVILNQLSLCYSKRYYSDNAVQTILKFLFYELSQQTRFHYFDHFDRRFTRLIAWLEINYSKDWSLGQIAEYFEYNKSYLCRIFKQRVGQNISDYISALRIQNACLLLINTDFTVKQIADELGYHDDKYFMRQFKSQIHVTPSAYRNAYSMIAFNDE